MSKVGIIANPAAGKDVRRLVAHASVTDNTKKAGIVRRAIAALSASGVGEIVIMPDSSNLGLKALEGLRREELKGHIRILDMLITGSMNDSIVAARLMNEQGVNCIITVGGDGTNRAVAHACGDVPLVPISTGTNNVFPFMVEGTTAGLAAGIVARGLVDGARCVAKTKRLKIIKNDGFITIALIDVVVLVETFIGSKAILDMSKAREIIAVQAHPSYIGMASIGGSFHPIGADDDEGLYIRLGKGKMKVQAAVAPGLIREVEIEKFRVMNLGDKVEVSDKPSILALDGEREVEIFPEDRVEIELRKDGPRVVRIKETLEEAVKNGFFVHSSSFHSA
jgi:predicted polyphosphate/ATP-dependent NAD kinase